MDVDLSSGTSPRPMRAAMVPKGTWREILPRLPDPILDLDLGDDGTLMVSTTAGVSRFTGSQWELIDPRRATQVAVADIGRMYSVIDGKPFCYRRSIDSPDTWTADPLVVASEVGRQFQRLATTKNGLSTLAVYAEGLSGRYHYEFYQDLQNSVPTFLGFPLDTCGQVAMAPDGDTWGIDDENNLYWLLPAPLPPQANAAKQVCVGGDESVWYLDLDGALYSFSGVMWSARTDAPRLERIAVGNRLQLAGVAPGNAIYRFCPDGYGSLWGPALPASRFTDFTMCADFSGWAYTLQPTESTWLWGNNNPSIPKLQNTPWTQGLPLAFYADADWSYRSLPSQTQAFMAANATTKQVVLAFRGSTPIDISYDAIWYRTMEPVNLRSPEQVARLVLWGYRSTTIRDAIERDLPRYIAEAGGPAGVSVFITGHSLGAGLATFAAYDLVTRGKLSGVASVTVINFASPVIGNQAFANSYNALGIPTYRLLVPNDPIDRMWIRWFQDDEFTHVADLVALPSASNLIPGTAHYLNNYVTSLARFQATLPPRPPRIPRQGLDMKESVT